MSGGFEEVRDAAGRNDHKNDDKSAKQAMDIMDLSYTDREKFF